MWLISGLIILFSSIGIDGFPLGSSLLREFGARPTNIFLAMALMGMAWSFMSRSSPLKISKRNALFVVAVLIGIPTLNLPVTILQAEHSLSGPILDWSKQYGMFLWGLTSYWIWRKLLDKLTIEQFGLLVCIGAILPLIAFFGDFFGSTVTHDLLGLVRFKLDDRPSGFNSEPSTYSAWVAFIWPIVFYYSLNSASLRSRAFAFVLFIALSASAILCNARTIAVILILQILYIGFWVIRSRSGLNRLIALGVFTILAIGIVAAFAERFSSLADSDQRSNIGRIGSTVTALRITLAHPFVGIGIGQLKYFFGAYAPDFALVSEEIVTYAAGLSEYRASSFNLFVRFVCEFGVVIGLFFSIIILRPIFVAMKFRASRSVIPYATLSALGGVGFWLSQDQYGYQPAILSLALLSNLLASRSRVASPGRPAVPMQTSLPR